jgi:predicted phosphodiesterase
VAHDLAIISDIHGNHLALQAVFEKIEQLQPRAVVCLGDIVGYGPRPVRCLDVVRRNCILTLCGNHDFGVVYGAEDFNPVAEAALRYHRGLIMPRTNREDAERKERWAFLKHLPHRHVRGEWLFVHGAPRNPIVEYLRKLDVMLKMDEKFSENFNLFDWLCFVGHTHRPGVITAEMKFLEVSELEGATYHAQPHKKAIINVGSVGQPRDRDTRACFVTVDEDGTVHYHRVAYDVEAIAGQIEATPVLDPSLARRLREGK